MNISEWGTPGPWRIYRLDEGKPTGERVCQECVDEARYQVVRWDVPRSNRVRRAL